MNGPFLDVSEVLRDPMISGPFVVYRRAADVNNFGEVSAIPQTYNARGVICAAHGKELQRLPASDSLERVISIVTDFMLQGPSQDPDCMPDMVGWGGSMYVVKLIDPYPQYGRGFIQALATSMEYLDPPPSVAQRTQSAVGPAPSEDSSSEEGVVGPAED